MTRRRSPLALLAAGAVTAALVPGLGFVTGAVAVSVDGRARGWQVLTRRSDGRVAFPLPALRPGRHTLAVRYAGSRLVAAASARAVVKVDRAPRTGKGGGGR